MAKATSWFEPSPQGLRFKRAWAAYFYARDVLKGRFHDGEPAIAADAWASFWYARHVLHGPFPAGEPAMRKDRNAIRRYRRFLARRETEAVQ